MQPACQGHAKVPGSIPGKAFSTLFRLSVKPSVKDPILRNVGFFPDFVFLLIPTVYGKATGLTMRSLSPRCTLFLSTLPPPPPPRPHQPAAGVKKARRMRGVQGQRPWLHQSAPSPPQLCFSAALLLSIGRRTTKLATPCRHMAHFDTSHPPGTGDRPPPPPRALCSSFYRLSTRKQDWSVGQSP